MDPSSTLLVLVLTTPHSLVSGGLASADGSMADAAEALGLSANALRKRIKRRHPEDGA